LLPIILKIVRTGFTIHTDEWSSYSGLGKTPEYVHRKITHKYNFVDPVRGVHIQNVESYNNKIKLKIKELRGLKEGDRADFLLLFMFVDKF